MGRRLGQHFLADSRVAERIAQAVTAADRPRLEIGGGRGALTRFLAERPGRLVVVELDSTLAEGLRRRFGERIEVHQGDVLKLRLSELDPAAQWAVVGNLPYYLTSDILVWLCDQWRQVAEAVVMVQAEVADRLLAEPGTKAYGRLTVMVRYRATLERLLKVSPGSFEPPPQVRSTVVRLSFRPGPAVAVPDEVRFFNLVEHGFRWRRKTLGRVLQEAYGLTGSAAQERLHAARIDPLRRAETLDLEEFARLSDELGGSAERNPP